MSLSKQELFDRIRRDCWQQELSIRALSKKYAVHRRLVREALASPVPKPRKRPARTSPRMEPYKPYKRDAVKTLSEFRARSTGERVSPCCGARRGRGARQPSPRARQLRACLRTGSVGMPTPVSRQENVGGGRHRGG